MFYTHPDGWPVDSVKLIDGVSPDGHIYKQWMGTGGTRIRVEWQPRSAVEQHKANEFIASEVTRIRGIVESAPHVEKRPYVGADVTSTATYVEAAIYF